jgi:homoaconitase/3-isopropylmalate dehydratase large subunit
MEVLSHNEGLLTNVEVLELLEERRASRALAPHHNVALQDREHVELQTIRYIKSSMVKDTTSPSAIKGLNAIKKLKLDLTEGEMIQIANHVPTCEVEIHAIVEECSDRLTSDQVTELLSVVKDVMVVEK